MLTREQIEEMDKITGLSNFQAQSRIDELRGLSQPEKTGETGLKGFSVGVGKGILSSVKGAGQLGEKIGGGILGGVEKLTGLPVKPEGSVYSDEATEGTILSKENLTPQTTAEKIGKGVEQIAEFALPATKVMKAGQGANFFKKLVSRALSSGTVASVQSGDVGKETAIASGVEVALPVAGKALKPAVKFVGGLFRGLGAGLSGASDDTLKLISQNAKTSKDVVKQIKASGQEQVLKDNVNQYIKGMSKLRATASQKFGDALEALSKTDIDENVIKKGGLQALKNNNVKVISGKVNLADSEILNPQLQKRASTLIESVNQSKITDGKSLREAIKRIDSAKIKNPGVDPDRIAYNRLLDDLSDGFSNAINQTTDKLKQANLAYSKAKGLAEATEDILGNVKFKNQSEILNISKKMDSLLKDKGLTQDVLKDFFESIGQDYTEFKTKEAVRQISTKAIADNSVGTNPFEIIRTLTSKIVPPKTVRDIAILTGQSEAVVKKIIETTSPTARGAIIKALISENER